MARFLALLIVSGALLTARASAHHSITAMYQEKEVVRLEGQLAQLNFRNPHSIMHLIVNDKGREVRYAVEWAAAGELEVQGITSHTLKIGDYLVITGSPARNPDDHRVRMTTLRRPKDDFNYSLR
jgi:hypothetical protein